MMYRAKGRCSARCESFRYKGLVAKLALGGKAIKVFLALDPQLIEQYPKYHLKDVSEKMNNPAEGVPYIIIGDKVFAGYSEQYDEQIKEAIKTLYDTKKDKRKDIINEMNIKYNIEEDKAPEEAKTSSKSNTGIIVLFNGLFVAIATAVIILFENNRFNKIEKKLNIIKKRVKKEDKEKKNID